MTAGFSSRIVRNTSVVITSTVVAATVDVCHVAEKDKSEFFCIHFL